MEQQDKPQMLIANPIYDVVFKYMLEDDKVAKLFLSALLGREVLELSFMPQEVSVENPDRFGIKRSFAHGLSIYRLDFSAKVRMPSGEEKLLIIELQKSKLRTATGRFRKYLGKQYMKTDLVRWIADHQPREYGAGIPIFPIFILGEGLAEFKGIPVVRISNQVSDHHNAERLPQESVFISSLFHEGLIVNVPALKERRRNDLEKLLLVFDQSRIDHTAHIMNVEEADFDERYRPIIRRLQKAASNEEIRSQMDGEDEILKEISDYEHDIVTAKQREEEAKQREEEAKQREEEAKQREAEERRQKEEAKQREEEAKQREAEERRQKEEAKQREEEAKQREAEERRQKEEAQMREEAIRLRFIETARELKQLGISSQRIAAITGLSEGEVSGL